VANLMCVCLGSAIGGGLRYLVALAALKFIGPGFPYGTLAVNVLGCYLLGFLMHLVATNALASPPLRLFLTTGILGGMTTYSAFNYETTELVQSGAWEFGLLNLAGTVFLSFLAGLLGLATGRLWVAW
jgi:CrcB protein